jgi:putative transposase
MPRRSASCTPRSASSRWSGISACARSLSPDRADGNDRSGRGAVGEAAVRASGPVATLVRRMGIEARYRKPRTSIPAREGSIYPYLLSGLAIERPNQVWATDISYIPMAHGFLYLTAILDIFSRKVLAWRLSNTLTTDFCLEALEEALARYGTPEIFNSDQGAQFTSEDWLDRLKATGCRISMDGKGRWIDNVFISSGCGAR